MEDTESGKEHESIMRPRKSQRAKDRWKESTREKYSTWNLLLRVGFVTWVILAAANDCAANG